eukprot:354208-Chlamydomonas_euryale.AAC.1
MHIQTHSCTCQAGAIQLACASKHAPLLHAAAAPCRPSPPPPTLIVSTSCSDSRSYRSSAACSSCPSTSSNFSSGRPVTKSRTSSGSSASCDRRSSLLGPPPPAGAAGAMLQARWPCPLPRLSSTAVCARRPPSSVLRLPGGWGGVARGTLLTGYIEAQSRSLAPKRQVRGKRGAGNEVSRCSDRCCRRCRGSRRGTMLAPTAKRCAKMRCATRLTAGSTAILLKAVDMACVHACMGQSYPTAAPDRRTICRFRTHADSALTTHAPRAAAVGHATRTRNLRPACPRRRREWHIDDGQPAVVFAAWELRLC